MRQKGKKKIRNHILTVVVLFTVMAGSIIYVVVDYVNDVRENYETMLKKNDRLILQSTRQVYVAAQDIRVGEIIEEEMVELRRTLCSQKDELLFTSLDIGKEALTDIAKGTFLNKCLVNQSGSVDGLREMCYRAIDLTENIRSYDVVDIRIRYPNGEDYVILSGKQILLDEFGADRCYIRVSEEELLLMSAAMVEVEQIDGTRIYTSRYPEPAIQKKSFVTYRPSEEIKRLIELSPNTEIEVQGRNNATENVKG